MLINANKVRLWKKDIETSVDLFNAWFLQFAPDAYRNARASTTKCVADCLEMTSDLTTITVDVLEQCPGILPTLRMTTCPPIARDRLVGLASANKNLVKKMEDGQLPPMMKPAALRRNLTRIADILSKMLDVDIFPWLSGGSLATEEQRYRASTIVADRLCGAVSDPIVRNAQEARQLSLIGDYLEAKGYVRKTHTSGAPITQMEPGTFAFRMVVRVDRKGQITQIPVDVVIQPKKPRSNGVPIFIEAKSAGDFTNVNKRRKEEATKMSQLRVTFGQNVEYILFLCGYFGTPYLGYEAAEGIDWVWEHRIKDMDKLGL